MMLAPWLLLIFRRRIFRDGSWAPWSGVSAGAVAGIVFALVKDPMPDRMWVLVALLAAVAIVPPVVLSCRWLARGPGRVRG